MAYPVNNGNIVVEAENKEERQKISDPLSALHLSVVRGCSVATDSGKHDERCEEAAPVVGVEGPHTGKNEDEDGQGEELQHSMTTFLLKHLPDCIFYQPAEKCSCTR